MSKHSEIVINKLGQDRYQHSDTNLIMVKKNWSRLSIYLSNVRSQLEEKLDEMLSWKSMIY